MGGRYEYVLITWSIDSENIFPANSFYSPVAKSSRFYVHFIEVTNGKP